jgi:hypothetical protein
MSLVRTVCVLGQTVVLYERTVGGTYVRAAATLHAKSDRELLESCHSVICVLNIESLGEVGGVEAHRTALNASAAVDTCGSLGCGGLLDVHYGESAGGLEDRALK